MAAHTRGGKCKSFHRAVGAPTQITIATVGWPTMCSSLFRIRNNIEIVTGLVPFPWHNPDAISSANGPEPFCSP
jgi:hypothetical protein